MKIDLFNCIRVSACLSEVGAEKCEVGLLKFEKRCWLQDIKLCDNESQ